MTEAVFAIPGDKDRRTGGFIYEATVLRVLNDIGCPTRHLELPDSFPDPTPGDMEAALQQLGRVPPHQPIILDGLVFGAIDPAGLSKIKAPIIAMIHHPLGLEAGLSPERAAFLRQNEAAALAYAHHSIVPSGETKRLLVSEFGGDPARITIAPPGFVRPVVNRQPVSPPLILSVGLLAPRKGHDILLNALDRISDLPWQAKIVGKDYDPDVTAGLLQQRQDLTLTDRVEFTGEVHGNALNGLFNAASVFALATRYEGYGMVLSEAMFYGLPCVTCQTGAVPETVGDAGMIVPPENSDAIADALRTLLCDPAKADLYSQRALKKAASLPAWTDTAATFAKVIRSLARTEG